jgi:hypothetical protein
MGEVKHTPGPWWVQTSRTPHATTELIYIVAADPNAEKGSGYAVVPAHVHVGFAGSQRDRDMEKANAVLVAAAPDLLSVARRAHAELELALDVLGHAPDAPIRRTVGLLAAAIAKAEGVALK